MQVRETMKVFSPSVWWGDSDRDRARQRLIATSGFTEALTRAGISILLTSRQGSLLAAVSAVDGTCHFTRAKMPASMGLAIHGSSLAVGTGNGLRTYVDVEVSPGEGSSFFPIGTHITGPVSIHDVAWGEQGRLWFVNTLFSALCTIDAHSQFKIEWQPPFVAKIGPYDCCHLSGMAMDGGMPGYVTALAATSNAEGWREHVPDSGILLDTQGNLLCDRLSLPHSPKLFEDRIWLLEAGLGRIVSISPDGGKHTIAEIPGVLRGMDFHDGCVFVGLSKIRPSSRQTAESLSQRFGENKTARIYAMDAKTGRVLGHVELPAIDEISSLLVIASKRISFLEPDHQRFAETFVCRLPDPAQETTPMPAPPRVA